MDKSGKFPATPGLFPTPTTHPSVFGQFSESSKPAGLFKPAKTPPPYGSQVSPPGPTSFEAFQLPKGNIAKSSFATSSESFGGLTSGLSTSPFQGPLKSLITSGRKRSLDAEFGQAEEQLDAGSRNVQGKRPAHEQVARGLFGKAMSHVAATSRPSREKRIGLTQAHQISPPQAAAIFGRRRSSASISSFDSSGPKSSTLICTTVPEKLNKEDILRKHFKRFGDVKRVICNIQKNSATIRFSTTQAAAAAKDKGKTLQGKNIHIYFQKKRPTSTDRVEGQLQQLDQATTKPGPPKLMQATTKKPAATSEMKLSFPFQALPSNVKMLSSVSGKSDAEKLAVLEKIDKVFRSRVIKESDWTKASIVQGTCPDMCPEKERYLRQHNNLLSPYEWDSNRKMNHMLVVKEYSRSSADQEEALPHELRPPHVLRITMDYLLTHVMKNVDHDRVSDWYDFLWNRTRAVRKEISIQQTNDFVSVGIMEECARFHICCAHELCETDRLNFDPKINNENLEKTMKTVLDMYDDIRIHGTAPDAYLPNETEFRGYHILLNVNKSADVLRELQNMKMDIRSSDDIKLAVAAFSAVHSNNFSRFFNVLRHATYLQASLLHRYFMQVRRKAIMILAKAYKTSKGTAVLPVDDVIRMLHFNDYMELNEFCANHVITLSNGCLELFRNETYDPEGSVSIFRSKEISSKMNGFCLGEIIAHNHNPSADLHVPTSSFNEDGEYIGPHTSLLAPSKGEESSTVAMVRKLESKGISNDTVKLLTKSVIFEVIDQSVLSVANEVFRATQQVLATSDVSNDVFNEFIQSEMKKMVSTVLVEEKIQREVELAEAEERARKSAEEARRRKEQAEEEERKRREEMRRKKEEQEAISRSILLIADALVLDFVKTDVRQISTSVYRDEKLNYYSDVITDDFIKTALHENLTDISSNVIKSERKKKHNKIFKQVHTRRSVIRFQKWREILKSLQEYRLACQTFPSAPIARNFRDQVRSLLPYHVGGGIDRRRSFPIDKRNNFKLSLQPPSVLLAQHVENQTLVNERITSHQAACFNRLPLIGLVNAALPSTPGDDRGQGFKLWKVGLVCMGPSDGAHLAWLQHKLGFRTRNSPDVKSSVVFLQDFDCVKDFDHLERCRVCVSCKNLQDGVASRSDIMGTSGLILFLSSVNDGRLILKNLKNLFHHKPNNPQIPILIVTLGSEGYDVIKALIMDQYSDHFSSCKLLELMENDFMKNSSMLKDEVRWLVSSYPQYPDVSCSIMRDVLEEELSFKYITPLHRHIALRRQQNLYNLAPQEIIEMYNGVIDGIRDVLTNTDLVDVSWPMAELQSHVGGFKQQPDAEWNTPAQFDKINSVCAKLKLPTFPDFDDSDSLSDIQSKVLKYCLQMLPNHTALAMTLDASIVDFIHSQLIEDCEDFVLHFPWEKVVNAIASTSFRDVIYNSEEGNMLVAYFGTDLHQVSLPQKFLVIFNQVEFNEMEEKELDTINLNESFHSQEMGATHNLQSILHRSKNKTNHEVSWIEEESDTQVTTNKAVNLRSQIKKEAIESDRFEKYLETLLREGAAQLNVVPTT
ncbi:germinal-center associated nuclear protein-like isoform X2 [Clavelina lepadiformis]|uniref:germinal-center associated nuclear protein-like isoform X2 n=1 Tax=Clavelina lepadiformis TaxID=159417 RepID=UPI004041F075